MVRDTKQLPNGLSVIIQELGLPRDAEVIPIRGEPFRVERGRSTHLVLRSPSTPGEWFVSIKCDYRKPFRRPS